MKVLVFLNELESTSIPLEISVKINSVTETDITIVSFYDSNKNNINSDFFDTSDINTIFLNAFSKFDFRAFIALQNLIKKRNFNILHTHHNFTGSIARIIANNLDIKIVNTEHRDHTSFSFIQNLVNFPTLPLSDCVVSNSKCTKNSFYWFEKILLKKDKQKVIYNGVDIEKINNINNTQNININKLKIVTVGRLIDIKNLDTLIKAYKKITLEKPNSELILIGKGPKKKELESLSKNLDISEKVKFKGLVNRETVYKILNKSDIFVVSSYSEGFCVAAVEAMASGLPVVASDIDVLHEVVGDTGLFADPKSPDSFADKILTLSKNTQKRKELGKKAKKRAETEFPIEKTAIQYYKLYKELIENN